MIVLRMFILDNNKCIIVICIILNYYRIKEWYFSSETDAAKNYLFS